MPLQSDKQYKVSWAGNTTPLAPDGTGNTAASLCGYALTNTASSARHVKFYDKASAPSVGTDVPKRTVSLAANTTQEIDFIRGKLFLSGLWVSVTTGVADTDNSAPTANDVLVTVDYQS
jgi:hypothetical protein